MIEIVIYSPAEKNAWDQFIKNCKNTHFFHQRDYMEYHADRFDDHSLLFIHENNILAALPANKSGDTLISHGGLTFGGLLLDKKIKIVQVLDLFSSLKNYLKLHSFKTLRYKAIPHIYHEMPAEEDLYALMIHGAKLVRRDVSSTINLLNKITFSGGKKNGIAKGKKNGVILKENHDFTQFAAMVNQILTNKYKTLATHTDNEMRLLANRFPENIKLFGAFVNDEMVAGALMYLTNTVAHTQYLATTETGREIGALDYLLDLLINDAYSSKNYFDFGISTEQQGTFLNQGLVSQKEMFGARAIMHDTYDLAL